MKPSFFIPTLSLAGALCLALTAPLAAAELKGADAAAAINGKSFSCNSGDLNFTLEFANSDPGGNTFPFVYKDSARSVKNAYKIKKNGRVTSKKSGQTRRLFGTGNGTLTIKSNGRPDAICVPR